VRARSENKKKSKERSWSDSRLFLSVIEPEQCWITRKRQRVKGENQGEAITQKKSGESMKHSRLKGKMPFKQKEGGGERNTKVNEEGEGKSKDLSWGRWVKGQADGAKNGGCGLTLRDIGGGKGFEKPSFTNTVYLKSNE